MSLLLGFLVRSEIEDDAYVQPVVVVNWGISEALRLSMEAATSRGGEVRLGYSFNDNWKIGMGIGFRRERFRLNGVDAVIIFAGNRENGVGEEEATTVTGRVVYTFDAGPAIELYAGATVDGKFTLENQNGEKIAKSDYDDGGFGGILLKFPF